MNTALALVALPILGAKLLKIKLRSAKLLNEASQQCKKH